MRRLLLILPVLLVMALGGCTGQYLTQASNKNPSGMVSANANAANAAAQCQKETWCHNGWCSSHCE